MFGRRKVTHIARRQAQAKLLCYRRLERVGQLLAVAVAQRCGQVRSRLVNSQGRKTVQQTRGLARGLGLKPGQHLGSGNDGYRSLAVALRQVLGRGGNAIEMVDQDHRVE